MRCLTDVTLLLLTLLADLATNFASLHVGAVAQLPLLVLEVGIIGRIWAGGKVIIGAHYVVVRWCDASVQSEVVLIGDAWAHAESLRSNLRRIETSVDTKLPVAHRLLVLHALVDLLLGIDAELAVVLIACVLRSCSLSGGGLARSFGRAFIHRLRVRHRHLLLHNLAWSALIISVWRGLGDHDVWILDYEVVTRAHIEFQSLRGTPTMHILALVVSLTVPRQIIQWGKSYQIDIHTGGGWRIDLLPQARRYWKMPARGSCGLWIHLLFAFYQRFKFSGQ